MATHQYPVQVEETMTNDNPDQSIQDIRANRGHIRGKLMGKRVDCTGRSIYMGPIVKKTDTLKGKK